jgi:murein DD-endopeptidase MepM/ murein hydrolase activator NlpD
MSMVDHRAGSTGPLATGGKRVARHAAEQPLAVPYVGRRAARPVTVTIDPPDDVSGHLLEPSAVLRTLHELEATVVAPTLLAQIAPPEPEPEPEPPVLTVEPPIVLPTRAGKRSATYASRPSGRRVARTSGLRRLPSLPLVAGIAVLAVSTGGALQAMNSGLNGSSAHRLTPASALSGSSAVASASLVDGRTTVVSRSADRTASSGNNLQAAADAAAKQRQETLSGLQAKAAKQAHEIQLHQWVLPVAPGTYHLTARFGDYSPLWANFHTGLDFAAPTGTPIMAVAAGTITEVGYSGAYGNRTIERLPDGTELWYCHQNSFATSVGADVRPGQVIGYIGSTGNVTGPHLHLEVHPGGGDAVDPYAALVAHGLYPGPPA